MLDMAFIIERKHRLYFHFKGAFHELERTESGEWRVGVFCQCIRKHFYQPCATCGNPFKGEVETPNCSKCGALLTTGEITMEQLYDALREVTGKKVIRDEMWLRGDLKFY